MVIILETWDFRDSSFRHSISKTIVVEKVFVLERVSSKGYCDSLHSHPTRHIYFMSGTSRRDRWLIEIEAYILKYLFRKVDNHFKIATAKIHKIETLDLSIKSTQTCMKNWRWLRIGKFFFLSEKNSAYENVNVNIQLLESKLGTKLCIW